MMSDGNTIDETALPPVVSWRNDDPPRTVAEKIAIGEMLLQRAKERSERMLAVTLAAEKAEDDETVWLGMASRAQNQRFIGRLERDLELLRQQNADVEAFS